MTGYNNLMCRVYSIVNPGVFNTQLKQGKMLCITEHHTVDKVY